MIITTYDTRQILGVLYIIFRSIKFFSQTKKKSGFPQIQKISFVLGINWLLLAVLLIGIELDHQLALFEPLVLLRWRLVLASLVAFMLINEIIYDRIQAEKHGNKFWFKWAIYGKLLTFLGISFMFIWLYNGSPHPENNILVFILIAPLLIGLAIWWYAHRKQPKEPTEYVSSV